MLINLLVVGFFLAAGCNAQERFPNANYLGMGYNVVTGNPDNDQYDPGFTSSVLKFTWSTGTKTPDGKYLVPDHSQALRTPFCSFRCEALTAFDSQSYQDALSVDVSADDEIGLWGARFTGSDGYKKVSEGTNQYRRIYTSANAKCIQYQLSYSPFDVTSNFAEAVSSLPLERNDDAYNTFINTYGTHFTSRVTMGAKVVVLSEFDEHAFARMEEEQLDIERATELSFSLFAAGNATETERERQEREKFEAMRKSYSVSFLGSHLPADGRWETWAQTAANSPYPVSYELAPLTSLFTSTFFPDMLADDLNTRRNLLSDAYDVYCNGLSGCGTPPPDQIPVRTNDTFSTDFGLSVRSHPTAPVRMRKTVKRFKGATYAYCPYGYKILSCGIKNVRTWGAHDKQRYARPSSNNRCRCYDREGAYCVAWCTANTVRYTAIYSPYHSGYSVVTAYCPSGYKV